MDDDITPLDERIGDSVDELYNFSHAALDFLFEMSKLLRLLAKPDVRFDVAAAEGKSQLTTARDFLRAYTSTTSRAVHLLEQADNPAAPACSEERDSALVQLNQALDAFNADRAILDLNSDDFIRRTALLGFAAYSGSISDQERTRYERSLDTTRRLFRALHAALAAANGQISSLIVALVSGVKNEE